MPILVNGEIIPRELIQVEERRLAQVPEWQGIPEGLEKGLRLREAAEWCAIDRILLRQEADKDPRPIDAAFVAAQVERLSAAQSCRVIFDDGPLARQIEAQLRLDRTLRELIGPVPEPTEDEIARLYKAHRAGFELPETVHAAHIVKHVDETHPDAEARAGIADALAALESGEPFPSVAERYSDCKGNGGDLGSFARGEMVEEFESVVFAMNVGDRSSIFRTAFGYHIAEVRARTPAGVADLGEARESIKGVIIAARQEQSARAIRDRLRAQAHIRRVSARQAQALVNGGERG